ncbi:MAG: LPS export ABC transporter periplasmic protein LptC [Candidatus Glassbacteria bacterium RIFCSPLOWO2_12_FULL_58_11]|uniref:LPS export ABC transporter periplasmic protein LptC n=2 Tax=Candidatus Glassiibacteriota TaxID=1817805 RepID=A0A1F5YWE9_9BACT|nr:MAG: LPS export ABC transporter periplasmic protein LptC [Candidatus Glassbacteria bacterium GWA2_58_10]OGG04509.1 MAG: LPS export ABC transporter periplasmic protein LptC [Candidatus Glassbacteria bacterium RIFCSPLOWO2_12_FULL_58_11]
MPGMFSSRLAGIIAGAFFMVCWLVIPGCSNRDLEPAPAAEGTEQGAPPDQVFDGFEMTVTDNGIKKGWVTADRAEKYTQLNLFKASNLKVVFYTSNGEVKSVMTSLKGLIHTDSGDMEAIDSVVVLSQDSSKTLTTGRLIWKKEENLILGDSAVVIHSPRGVVYGDGIKADAGFENLEVKNPTGDINVLGEKF